MRKLEVERGLLHEQLAAASKDVAEAKADKPVLPGWMWFVVGVSSGALLHQALTK